MDEQKRNVWMNKESRSIKKWWTVSKKETNTCSSSRKVGNFGEDGREWSDKEWGQVKNFINELDAFSSGSIDKIVIGL